METYALEFVEFWKTGFLVPKFCRFFLYQIFLQFFTIFQNYFIFLTSTMRSLIEIFPDTSAALPSLILLTNIPESSSKKLNKNINTFSTQKNKFKFR